MIHRDIKPSNILLGTRSGHSIGQVYLVDFGSVQTLAAAEGSTITVVGTYGYMPPEQFGGRAIPASDLYSLGATLIYVITGKHPADLPQKDLRIQFESKLKPTFNLSCAHLDWIHRMTDPNLNNRFEAAIEALEHPRQRTEFIVSEPKIFGSRIRLETHENNVKILIPPARFNYETIISKKFYFYWGQVLLGLCFLFAPIFLFFLGSVQSEESINFSFFYYS